MAGFWIRPTASCGPVRRVFLVLGNLVAYAFVATAFVLLALTLFTGAHYWLLTLAFAIGSFVVDAITVTVKDWEPREVREENDKAFLEYLTHFDDED